MLQFLPINETARSALSQLTQGAMTRNPQILALQEKLDEARGFRLQAGLRPNPSLELEGETDVEGGGGIDRSLSVGYFHTFETGGKRRRRMEVAEGQIAISEYELAEERRTVAGQLAAAFLRVLALDQTIASERELEAITERLVNLVDQRVRQGEAARVELNQARVEQSRVAAELGLLQSRRRVQVETIQTLTGSATPSGRPVTGEIGIQPPGMSADDLLTRALRTRPDLNALRTELATIQTEIELLEAQRTPDITGFLRYSLSRPAFDLNGLDARGRLAPIRDLDHELSGGISFDLPFRDRNQGKLAAAAARQRSLRLQVSALEASIREAVTVAYERYTSALNSLEIFQDQVLEEAQQSVDTLREAYQMGEISFAEVLNEQRRVFELRRAYNDVLSEYAGAAADLAQASALQTP